MESRGRPDDRAVSTLIGAVFLLGVLVILLAVYQATIVPQQNKKIEFDHSQVAQDDMLDLRNAVLEAKSTGDTTFAEVKLGTDYPPRTFGLNPPAAPGALRTGEPRPINVSDKDGNTLSNVCPGSDPIDTRYLTHKIDYNQYQNPPTIVYENTVLYLNFSGRNVLLTNETLFQGDKVEISPINTSFSEQGVGATSVEPIPGNIKERNVEGANIEFPSRLSASTWERLLSEDMDNIDRITKSDGNVTIEAKDDTQIEIACSPVGLNQVPDGGERGGGDTNINPVAPNDVQLVNISISSNKDIVTATLRNNNEDNDAKIEQVRLAFYFTPDGIDEMNITEVGNNTSPTLTMQLLGDFETADPPYEIPKNTSTSDDNQKDFEFTVYDRSDNKGQRDFDKNQDWFALQVIFENGVTATYFVSAEEFQLQ